MKKKNTPKLCPEFSVLHNLPVSLFKLQYITELELNCNRVAVIPYLLLFVALTSKYKIVAVSINFSIPGAATFVCGVCKEIVGKSENIKYMICSQWVHALCAQLSQKKLSVLKSIEVAAFV